MTYTQEVEEALRWADEVVIYEPGASKTQGHIRPAILASAYRSSLSTIRAQEEEIAGLRRDRKKPTEDGTIIIEAVELYPEAKEMARTCLGFTLEDGSEEIRLIAEYLFSREYALNERIRELADDDSCCAAERATVAELRTERERTNQTWRDMRDANLTLLSRAEAAEAKVAALEKEKHNGK